MAAAGEDAEPRGHRGAAPLHIRPRLSPRLGAILVALHGGALLISAVLPLPWHTQLALFVLVSASLAHGAGVHLWPLLPWAVREVVWHADGSWVVTFADGRERQARLADSSLVAVGLVILKLRCGRLHTCSLPLFADALDADLARRLRVRLRQNASRTVPKGTMDFR